MNEIDDLGLALKLAVNDLELRNNFYIHLLKSTVYLISANDFPHQEETILSEDTEISILQIKNQKNQILIPFFSSPEHIFQLVNNVVNYVKINMQVFLKIINCAPCVLNPGGEYSKEFTTEELVALLDGRLLNKMSSYTAKAGSNLLIGKPNVEPTKLLQILKEFFNKCEIVLESYIAEITLEHDPAGSHLLVAVKATEALDVVFNDVSNLIENELGKQLIVDFIDLSESQQFRKYFQDIEPFFKQ